MRSCSLLLLAFTVLLLPASAADRKPNIILIMVDDLGYEDLACYGHDSIRTPVLDGLAASGIRLTNFHSGATVCTPSRMALLTGAYPVRLGWKQGVVGYKMGRHDGMAPEALTIAEIFKSAGYATAISGKWHIGDQPDTRPDAQGFDRTFFIPLSNNQIDEIWRGGDIAEKPFENRLLTEKFTEEAKTFIKANKEQPFFLYLAYTAPHFPVEPHPEWEGLSSFGKYGDVVEELDSRIGEVLTTVRDLALEKHTIVVFMSDNGPQPGQKANCRPYRGEKWSALEGGTRVPGIVSWPGVIPAGQTSNALVSAMDLLPTLCRAAGINWQERSQGKPTVDGLDVWDTFLGKAKDHPRTELLHWHGMDGGPQAITSGDWKLFFNRRHALEGSGTRRATPEQNEQLAPLRKALKSDNANSPFLIKLSDDPGELTDLSKKSPERVQKMQARAEELAKAITDAPALPVAKP